MKTYRFLLEPRSAFGTPLAGDTFFGQLCWSLRHQSGDARLNELLRDYTNGKPFAVVSDGMPAGHLPLPTVPSISWTTVADEDRKALKKKVWLPIETLIQPFAQWQGAARAERELGKRIDRDQPHNTINRETGTTGTGRFAPYMTSQRWFEKVVRFDLYVVLDEERLALEELTGAIDYIGAVGFGRDASTGLGRFARIGNAIEVNWPAAPKPPNSYLALGPCAPQGQGFCATRSYWQMVTRFGRHGDAAVHRAQPFKRPVLMATAGSVFWPDAIGPRAFVGQGLGGVDRPISDVLPQTVQQGYAPVIAIHRPQEPTQ